MLVLVIVFHNEGCDYESCPAIIARGKERGNVLPFSLFLKYTFMRNPRKTKHP